MAGDPTTEDERRALADLGEPVLAQVGTMGDAYDAWVHRSVGKNTGAEANAAHVECGDPVATRWPGSLRIFRNRLLESFSHIPWWLVLLVWVPIVVALFVAASTAAGLSLPAAWMWAGIGFFLWTFTEYVLHRFVFHYRPRSAFGRKFHFLAHGIHHLDPWDPTRLVFPPLAGIVVAAGLFGIHLLFLPLGPALASMSGLLAGYITYDMTHYYTHHAKPTSRWGKYLKAYHLAHHHKHWTAMYGVSQPLWDIVFRTGRPKD